MSKDKKLNLIYRLIVLFIFLLGLYLRVYRTSELLVFSIDQGDDALSIYKIWHDHTFLSLGPMTRWVGVYIGPHYYYLLSPFYWMGNGNPVYPAIFIATLTSLGSLMMYFLGKRLHSRLAGLLALLFTSLSVFLVVYVGRWLSHPPILFLLSPIFTYGVWRLIEFKEKKWWIVLAFILGLIFQLESANAFFVFFALALLLIWERKHKPDIKTTLFSLSVFLVHFIPQIIYDFRSNHELSRNLYQYLITEGAISWPGLTILRDRAIFIFDFVRSVFFRDHLNLLFVFFCLSAVYGFYLYCLKTTKKSVVKTLLIMILPLFLAAFYRGNRFDLYRIHMQYIFLSIPALLLLISIGLAKLFETTLGKIAVSAMVAAFLFFNLQSSFVYLQQDVRSSDSMVFKNQLEAIDWMVVNSDGPAYDIAFYTNGFLTYDYNYLYLWKTGKLCDIGACSTEGVRNLFLLYETKPRWTEYSETTLLSWLEEKRYDSVLVDVENFGLIRVEKRIKN